MGKDNYDIVSIRQQTVGATTVDQKIRERMAAQSILCSSGYKIKTLHAII
jgi:hypothetical protein